MTWYLGTDNMWHRKGWPDVAPGKAPVDPSIPVTVKPLLQVSSISVKSVPGVTPPPPPPPPPPTGILFGSCPAPNTSGASAVTGKWGIRAASRVYYSGSDYTIPSKPAGTLVHASYKPPTTITDAQIDVICKGMAGHVVTFWHESDNDGLTGTALSARIGIMNRLYDRNVALGRPCIVAPTFVGDLWSGSKADSVRDVWMTTLKGDLIGIDYDGIHDLHTTAPADNIYRANNTTKEFVCSDELATAKRYITRFAQNGWTGIIIPEFGTSRAVWDTDGSGRALWMKKNTDLMKAEPLVFGSFWYDTASKGNTDVIDVGSPEYTYWRLQVALNPAYTP